MRKGVLSPKAKVSMEAVATIRIIQICDRFQTFPNAGGLFDQDSFFVYILDKYLEFESLRAELDQNKTKSAMPHS